MPFSPKGRKTIRLKTSHFESTASFFCETRWSKLGVLLLSDFCKLYLCQTLSQATLRQLYIWPPKTCSRMFIAALFAIAPNWKPPRCPSAGERVNKLIHPHNEILPGSRRCELRIHTTTWMDCRGTRLSESSRAQKTIDAARFRGYEVLEETKFIYGDRSQNCGCLWGISPGKGLKGAFWDAGNIEK